MYATLFSLKYYTSRMLQPYCPNSVIILLFFLQLPSVSQPSKQTFAYEVTATDLVPSAVSVSCKRVVRVPSPLALKSCGGSQLFLNKITHGYPHLHHLGIL